MAADKSVKVEIIPDSVLARAIMYQLAPVVAMNDDWPLVDLLQSAAESDVFARFLVRHLLVNPGPMCNGREITHCPCQTSGSNKGDPMSELAIERVIKRAVHCHVAAAGNNDPGCIKALLESAADSPIFRTTLIEYLCDNLGNPETGRTVLRLADFAYQTKNTEGLPNVARNIIVQVFMLREESEPAE